MSSEEIFSIIQPRNDLSSTMTDSQLPDLEFLVLNTSQSAMKTIIYKEFYWCNILGPKEYETLEKEENPCS